jgi:DNA-binding LacI/PurR family transcriptional regulator
LMNTSDDSHSKETRKYLIIAEQLRRDILSGKYKVGENIPAVRKLAVKYNVTPLTASKATAYLASLGYLVIKQGSGGKVIIPEKNNRKYTITLLVNKERSNLEMPINYFYKDIYLAYLLFLNNKNYNPNIVSYKKDEESVPDDFNERLKSTDGVIILGDLPDCYYKFFERRNIPLAIFGEQIPPEYSARIGTVRTDMVKLEEAVHYLVSLGHRNILFSLDHEIYRNSVYFTRLELIRKTLESSSGGSPFRLEVFQFTADDSESAARLQALMDSGFSATVCYNDISALNLYSLVSLLGKNIPSDLSVIGIDDILPSKMATPPLTTVRVDIEELTLKAINIIEQLLTDHTQKRIIEQVDTELILRKSVARNTKPTSL